MAVSSFEATLLEHQVEHKKTQVSPGDEPSWVRTTCCLDRQGVPANSPNEKNKTSSWCLPLRGLMPWLIPKPLIRGFPARDKWLARLESRSPRTKKKTSDCFPVLPERPAKTGGSPTKRHDHMLKKLDHGPEGGCWNKG